ncbi:hypothetical protein HPP92_024793 [Vanilla planifolia]|uniref:Kinesin motor domain-containing protein n=1 Tax=Vanilla planifolia TaxID=51239 RepID=A0A835U8E8_VANPL|nr:hypothetical protein HPP92_025152 [Vanilla planifolia]KAG0453489.1 hypothetical protein HPP92_024793 [Vanilla planifolia]
MHHVRSTSDVMALMILGEKNRAFSCTAMNSRSSRSHSILTIHVCGRDASGDVLRSCLHLVDLAGSERLDKSEVTGERLKEALHINKSLSCLGDVFAALAQKSSYIPYRNSKLTLLLQNSLGGQAKMLMLAHVSPEAESCAETISTLKFAQRVSTVELGSAQMNKESNEIRELKEQLDNLKKELDNKEREKTLYLHKIKDNAAITERSKQNYPSPTQPRPRGLVENGGGYLKYPNANLGKSPLPRPKFSADQPVAQHNNQQETRSLNVKHTQLEEEQLKEVVLEYGKADASNKSFGQVNDGGRIISTCSPCIFGSPSVDHLSSLGSTNGKLDELATPESGNNTKPRSLSNVKSTKGTNFRKSLQTIGKFINGSEKRNYHQSLMQATKHERDADTTRKTPATAESRKSRRQSLTTLQASEIKASRRSSLGGKSVESLTTLQASEIKASRRSSLGGKSVESCVQVGKTPASQASAKATKPWL